MVAGKNLVKVSSGKQPIRFVTFQLGFIFYFQHHAVFFAVMISHTTIDKLNLNWRHFNLTKTYSVQGGGMPFFLLESNRYRQDTCLVFRFPIKSAMSAQL